MSDKVIDLNNIIGNGNTLQKLLDTTASLDSKVVKTAEGIVSVVSKPLAKTLVRIDHTFKNILGGVVKGALGKGNSGTDDIE